MNQLGSLLNQWLKKSGYHKKVKQQQAVVYWREIVGDYTAHASQAVKVEKGVLWVKVKNSTWLHHLSMLKSQILRNLKQYSGNNTIKDIYFFWGEMEEEGGEEEEMRKYTSGQYSTEIYEGKLNDNKEKEEVVEEEEVDLSLIREWLSYLPEEDAEIKEKLQKLIYKRYHING